RMDNAVQLATYQFPKLVSRAGQVLRVGHVQLDELGGLVHAGDHPARQTDRPAGGGDHDGGPLALGDVRDGIRNGGVHGHSGDQDVLALEQAHGVPFVCRGSGQWPIPRPPSTGMTAPETYPAASLATKSTAAATSSV